MPARPAWSCPRATKLACWRGPGGARLPDRPPGRPLPRASCKSSCLRTTAVADARIRALLADARRPGAACRRDPAAVEAHVGTARRLAMDEACRRLLLVGPDGLIATTDADDGGADLARRDAPRGRAWRPGGRWPDPDRPRGGRRWIGVCAVGSSATSATSLVDEVTARIDPGACRSLASPRPVLRGQPRRHGRRVPGGSAAWRSCRRERRRPRAGAAPRRHRDPPQPRVFTSGRLRGRTPARTLGAAHLLVDPGRRRSAPPVPNATSVVTRAVCRRALRDQWRRARAGHGACLSEVARRPTSRACPGPWLREASCVPRRSGCCSTPWRSRRPGPDKTASWTCARRSSSSGLAGAMPATRRIAARFARHSRGLPLLPPSGAGRGHPPRRHRTLRSKRSRR